MHDRQRNSRGFTLIELLVVIGIIAILAAIAVPNYSEALNSSKVARFKGDCKAVETAIEVYNAEFGSYPPPDKYPVTSTCYTDQPFPDMPGSGFTSRRLTTPIAYLGKVPIDTFRLSVSPGSCYPVRQPYMYAADFPGVARYGSTAWSNYVSWTYAYLTMIGPVSGTRPTPAIWMVSSPGPDGQVNRGGAMQTAATDKVIQYDPTNGTKSLGDLFKFGPGLGFGLGD